ncbi:MAG: efflux RND transporter periplasmic adaptor subunit [Flavobacteriaceae bacterium]
MNRKLIIGLSGVALIVLSIVIAKVMIDNKPEKPGFARDTTKQAFVTTYVPQAISVDIVESGNLMAKHKVELFSEVQGVLEPNTKDFRVGVPFKKGEVIVKINSDEHLSTLNAQKSVLQNLIASIMPDIRLDYPESYQAWSTYLNDFSLEGTVEELPEAQSDKEKYFITGRNVYTTYYNVKNLEARLEKFNLRAPYNGILTEALVTTGTLIRPGQKMGDFIDPSVYELGLSINASLADALVLKEEVILEGLSSGKSIKGHLSRINAKIDANTQTLLCFVEVKGSNLKEGMFLRAIIPGKQYENAYLISRKLLVNNKSVYIVQDDVLDLVPVNTLHFNDDSVVISGLTKGQTILSRSIPGAYPGMKVSTKLDPNTDRN